MGTSNSKLTSKANSKRQLNTISYDRPSRPGKPTLVPSPIGTDPDIITIRWEAPASRSTSSLKINGYVVEHRRIGSPHWVRVTPIKVRHTELTLTGLEPDCRYQFRVFAENNSGISESSPISEPLAISVNQLAASVPSFIETLKDIIVIENEKAEITVKFEGVPDPKISWYIDGKEVYSNRCVRIKTDDSSSTLIFHQVSLAYYQAEIKCTATNWAGHAVTKAIFTVKAPPRIRFDRHYEEGMLFEEGDNVKLKALVVGYPNPFVNWYHSGVVLANSDRCESSYSGNISVLKIKDTRKEDAGEYQLHAINEIGEDVASIFVNVAHKPRAPENIILSKKQRNSVLLSWAQPKDDGGCKIEKYIVEYYKIGWNMWLKALSCNELSTVLDNLIEGGQYKFRVKAENLYGVSCPSLESDVITIGNFITDSCSDVLLFKRSEESLNGNSTLDKANKTIKKLQAPEKPKRKKFKENHEFSKYETGQQSQMTNDFTQRVKLPPLQPHRADKNLKLSASFDQSILHRNNLRNAESELMLVLLPDDNQQINKRSRAVSAGTMSTNEIPPPLSLSAPELGCDQPEYSTPLERNSVSSTELLRESVAARLYESMRKQFDTNAAGCSSSSDEGNAGDGKMATSSTAMTDSNEPIAESSAADSDEAEFDDPVLLDESSASSSSSSSSSSAAATDEENSKSGNRTADVLYDDGAGHSDSSVSFGSAAAFGEEEFSGRDSGRFAPADNTTPLQRSDNCAGIAANVSSGCRSVIANAAQSDDYEKRCDDSRRYGSIGSGNEVERRSKQREQTKALKPILKHRVSGQCRNDIAGSGNSVDDCRPRREKIGKKVRIAVAGETSLPDEECNGWAVGSAVAVDHYSAIVNEFNSSQRRTPTATARSKTVYLTYDQLREVARQLDTNEQFVLDDNCGAELRYERGDSPSSSSSAAEAKKNPFVDGRAAADLRDKVQRKVRLLFDFALDFIMYLFACWLYCFSSELLAVPIIVLIVSRQLCANVRACKIVKYIPFVGRWNRTGSDFATAGTSQFL